MDHSVYLHSLAESFDAKLEQLIHELESYSNEDVIWKTTGKVSNSGGRLAVHLLGNLNHFVGSLLGSTGYVRNRPLEFSMDFKSRSEILLELNSTRKMVRAVLTGLDPEKISGEYPAEFSGTSNPDYKSLIHIFGHLAYHVGQINYHRRLLDN